MLRTCSASTPRSPHSRRSSASRKAAGARTARALSATDASHARIGRSQLGRNVPNNWVYHRPEIDCAMYVGSREMDASRDAALIKYLKGRRVWLVEPDEMPPRLSPYPGLPSAVPTIWSYPQQ